jgi:hypothetical protein
MKKRIVLCAAAAIALGVMVQQSQAQSWALELSDFDSVGNDTSGSDIYIQIIGSQSGSAISGAGSLNPGGAVGGDEVELGSANYAGGASVFLTGLGPTASGPDTSNPGSAFARAYLVPAGSGAGGIVAGDPFWNGGVITVNTGGPPPPLAQTLFFGSGQFDGSPTDFTPGAASGSTIPEPGVVALLGLGTLVILVRRRKVA